MVCCKRAACVGGMLLNVVDFFEKSSCLASLTVIAVLVLQNNSTTNLTISNVLSSEMLSGIEDSSANTSVI